MDASKTISGVICAYTEQRWGDLVAAVDSVQRQTQPAQEIIVVIDHNTELFAKAQCYFSDVLVIENYQSRGLSGARNSGINQAKGQIIAFLDDDARAMPDWLELLLSEYETPNVLGVGGKIDPLWPDQKPAWFPDEFGWVVGCTYIGMPETVAPVRNLIGANMSLRSELFNTISFRESMGRIDTVPVGCEETELCIRARKLHPEGLFLYQPRARVLHKVTKARASWNYFRARCYAEGLSKAQVTQSVGTADGLSAERAYTLRVLPRGVIRGALDTISKRKGAGAMRAVTIVAGVVLTAFGYARGRLRMQFNEIRQKKLSPSASSIKS